MDPGLFAKSGANIKILVEMVERLEVKVLTARTEQ